MDAFAYCSALTSVSIPGSVTNIGSEAFVACTNLASVVLSDSVAEIEDGVFSDCTALTSITIPGSVTLIGSYAFNGSSALTSFYFLGDAPSVGYSSFPYGATIYYYVGASGWGSTLGGCQTVAIGGGTAPANDLCGGAYVIPSASTIYTNTQSTLYATSAGDPTDVTNLSNGVWYVFTPQTSGYYMASTFGSDFDTVLALYTGSCGSLSLAAYGDSGTNKRSMLTRDLTAGTTYYFQAGGYNGESGTLAFQLQFVDRSPAPVILDQPRSQSVLPGSRAAFSVNADGAAPLYYQWLKDGSIVSGAASNAYAIASTQAGDAGNYSVTVSNAFGFVVSSNAWLTVISPGTNLITFDDLTNMTGSVPSAYHGITWSNFSYVAPVAHRDEASGYTAGMVSKPNVALNSRGMSASITCSNRFNFNSGFFTAACNEGLQLEVKGYYQGTLLYITLATLSSTTPTYLDFGYSGVDEVDFTSSGGVQNTNYAGNGAHFVMDSVAITILTNAQTVANDYCDGAYVIPSNAVYYTNAQSTLGATSTGDPADVASLSKGVWYVFTPQTSGYYVASTIGSGFDTVLALYTGSPGALSLAAFNDDLSIDQTASRVATSLTAGTTYYFLIGGYEGATGALMFNLSFAGGTGAVTGASVAYLRSDAGQPWDDNDNEFIMTSVFGTNWQDLRYESAAPAALFSSSTRFIFMEGSAECWDGLNGFLSNNLPAMSNWVAAGGSLFINAAPYSDNETNYASLGFGATLTLGDISETVGAVNPAHAIFNGPFLPVALSYTGDYFGHGSVAGKRLVGLLTNTDNGNFVLAERSFGAGHLLFGGMTQPSFHSPSTEASNLLANIVYYGASFNRSSAPPSLLDQPQSQAVAIGLPAVFSVNATGAAPLYFQWRLNGTNIPGSTSTNYSIASASKTNAGAYTVVVTNSYGAVTSAPAFLTVAPLLFTHQPAALAVAIGGTASFNVGVEGVGKIGYKWFKAGAGALTNGTRISGAATNAVKIKNLTASDEAGYYVVATNAYGAATSEVATLIVIETIKPTIKIAFPAAKGKVFSTNALARFTAWDNARVASVRYSVNNTNDWLPATNAGATNWAGAIPAGLMLSATNRTTNILYAKAVDTSTNESAIASNVFVFAPMQQLTLATNGVGSVSPWTNKAWLVLGDKYTNTAKGLRGNVFSNWTGGVESSTNVIKFVMASNFSLTANFVSNPFVAPAGNYSGVFYPPDGEGGVADSIAAENAGLLNLTLTTNGTFTGKLWRLGTNAAFSGQFDIAFDTLSFSLKSNVTATLRLDPASRLLRGKVAGNNWTSALTATRAAKTSTAPGKYTVLIVGGDNADAAPPGDGALIAVEATNGALTATGSLADGTPVAFAANAHEYGAWPVYASIYGGKGVLVGWAQFATNIAGSSVAWVKPAGLAKQANYAEGFSLLSREIVAAPYTAPASGRNALGWTNGWVAFEGADLPGSISDSVAIVKDVLKTNWTASITNLALTITNANGLISGSFKHPVTRATVTFKGVALQNQGDAPFDAGGWFSTTRGCGLFRLFRGDQDFSQ